VQPLRRPSEHKSAYAHTKSGASNRSNEATEMADAVTRVSGYRSFRALYQDTNLASGPRAALVY
jgi:hypothetical protein